MQRFNVFQKHGGQDCRTEVFFRLRDQETSVGGKVMRNLV